jgi:peptide/nickel transport system substrate-binding protein
MWGSSRWPAGAQSLPERLATTSRRLALLCGALAMTVAACQPSSPAVDDQAGGTVVIGLESEPEVLNLHMPDGNTTATGWVTRPVLLGAFGVTPAFTYEPALISDATISEDPFTVTYHILPQAVWDDGTPVSADDFAFTWRTLVDPANDVLVREGYELITSAEAADPKTITFTFSEPFAAWRGLFDRVLPEHVVGAADFNTVWNDELTAASGPFQFESWDRGRQLSLVRNDRYWGPRPALDRLVFRFTANAATSVRMLQAGEVDVIHPRATEEVVQNLRTTAGVTVEVGTGIAWEHLTLNTRLPLLDRPDVRRAIAHAIDRDLIARELLQPTSADLGLVDSVIHVPDQPQYRPIWADALAYDPEESARLLAEAGCEDDGDGVAVCDGQRLSLRYATIAGDSRREQFFEVLQSQLGAAGIEVHADLVPPPVLFGERLESGNFDLIQFAWIGGPEPADGAPLWRCDGEQNYNGYCDPRVDALFDRIRTVIDPDARTGLLHEADALIADAVPVIPLFQTAIVLAWNDQLDGLENNPTLAGPTWNTAQWAWRR